MERDWKGGGGEGWDWERMFAKPGGRVEEAEGKRELRWDWAWRSRTAFMRFLMMATERSRAGMAEAERWRTSRRKLRPRVEVERLESAVDLWSRSKRRTAMVAAI